MAKPKKMTISPRKPSIRRRVVNVPGQPPQILERQTIPRAGTDPNTERRLYGKDRVRTLIKRDEAKGITMPEATAITTVPGVVTGESRPGELVKETMTAPNSGKRAITPPRTGGGVLKVFNRIKRI